MAEALLRRPSALYYLYALVDRVPRRWRPPAAGVGGGPVEAQRIHDLTLIVSRVVNPVSHSVRTQAAHDDVLASLMDAEAVAPMPFGTAVVDLPGFAAVAWRAAGLAVVPTGPAPAYSFVSSTAMSHVPALAPTG